MKKYLPLTVLFLFLITNTEAQQKQNGFEKLKSFILKECSIQKKDSLRVVNLIDSLNRKFKVRRIKFVYNATGSNHFIYPGRVMYINIKDTMNIYAAWIGELVHAKQFSEKPIATSFKAIKGFLKTILRMPFSFKKNEKEEYKEMVKGECSKIVARFWVIYSREYEDNKTFEGQAHKIFEPDMYLRIINLLNGY